MINLENKISPPILSIAPRLDETIGSLRPLLAWHNSEGGVERRRYTLQIDINPKFNSINLLEWRDISEGQSITYFRIEVGCELRDHAQYFWRVMARDSQGHKSEWGKEIGGVTARFFVNSSYTKEFYGTRVPVEGITASSGVGEEKIQDYDESGVTYWEGCGDQESYWIQFDLGHPIEVSRIWLLCGLAGWHGRENQQYDYINQDVNLEGRIVDYHWRYSNNGENWNEVPFSQMVGSDAFRRDFLLDKNPILARYFKIEITKWVGFAPRLHEVTFYQRSQPMIPVCEEYKYVLVIGTYCSDQINQNTELRAAILGLNEHLPPHWKLKVVEVPAYRMSLEVLNKMAVKPVAICLTGSGRWGEMLPRFEYNGVFEIIRHGDIPILGVCNGHQLLAQQEEVTFVSSMGRSYNSQSIESFVKEDIPPILIQKEDPIFNGMINPFYGSEYHSWSIKEMPLGFEVLATSTDAEGTVCIEVIKAKDRFIYGTQFHPEKPDPWNLGKMVLINFLDMAVKKAKVKDWEKEGDKN